MLKSPVVGSIVCARAVGPGPGCCGGPAGAAGPRPGRPSRAGHAQEEAEGARENPAYVAAKTRRPQDSEHTLALREELVKETRLGRVMGPCRAPDGWGVTMASLPDLADMGRLLEPPRGDCFAALSFAITQLDENGDLTP
ncbi:POLA2 [Symbiodinium sp. CCMP2592]|nr:POLA2 [Symbiodinium sp. CCMP2592]